MQSDARHFRGRSTTNDDMWQFLELLWVTMIYKCATEYPVLKHSAMRGNGSNFLQVTGVRNNLVDIPWMSTTYKCAIECQTVNYRMMRDNCTGSLRMPTMCEGVTKFSIEEYWLKSGNPTGVWPVTLMHGNPQASMLWGRRDRVFDHEIQNDAWRFGECPMIDNDERQFSERSANFDNTQMRDRISACCMQRDVQQSGGNSTDTQARDSFHSWKPL